MCEWVLGSYTQFKRVSHKSNANELQGTENLMWNADSVGCTSRI